MYQHAKIIFNNFFLDLNNVFESFLPQLLSYPNPVDPLNGDAAALFLHRPEDYKAKIRGILLSISITITIFIIISVIYIAIILLSLLHDHHDRRCRHNIVHNDDHYDHIIIIIMLNIVMVVIKVIVIITVIVIIMNISSVRNNKNFYDLELSFNSKVVILYGKPVFQVLCVLSFYFSVASLCRLTFQLYVIFISLFLCFFIFFYLF